MKHLNLVVCFFSWWLIWHPVKMPNVVLKVLILHWVCTFIYYIGQDIRKKQSWDSHDCPGTETPFQCWADKIPCSVQFSHSVVSNSLWPHGLQHQLPEFTQTHVHWVGDAIQPSHPLSSASPPTFSLSQHQGLFQWVSSLPQEFQLQHQIPHATLPKISKT